MATDRQREVVFERRCAARTDTLGALRADFATWFDGLGLPLPAADVLLVLSELCSNAIEAAPDDHYVVRAECSTGQFVLQVSNPSRFPLPPRSDWGPTDVLAQRGRGLGIIELLSDSVASTAVDGVVTVTAVFELST